MNKDNYKWVVYFISAIIALTIGVQIFWNIKEYQRNKKRLFYKVSRSLDTAVEDYFANKTKKSFITINQKDSLAGQQQDTIYFKSHSRRALFEQMDSTLTEISEADSTKVMVFESNFGKRKFPFFKQPKLFPRNIDSILSKVMVSFAQDTLNIVDINSYVSKELKRNNLNIEYGLKLQYPDWAGSRRQENGKYKTQEYNIQNLPKKHLKVSSRSHYLPHNSKFEILFSNPTILVLKNSLVSILLSFLLSISIIASLIYLLKTIYKQKQLAEIKNDLINNITHEFKTPIATVSTALEAMKSFNALDDKEKSEKYIAMAHNQIDKLNLMVEKILETATLNGEDLILKKSEVNIHELIENLIEKYRLVNQNKTFIFNQKKENTVLNVDIFHFENAIDNLIDNAVKYGGDKIEIKLTSENNKDLILIKDNGKGIPKEQRNKVFEQFYRIPTGNMHNVKGFGIGLFYTKKIIEKHGGTIEINYENNHTIFKISLLNE
jgi:two-component system phosphate regulon sensor histidine kinase PhoR